METQKFFKELARVMPHNAEAKVEIRESEMLISLDEKRRFYVRPSGGITFPHDTVYDDPLRVLSDAAILNAKLVKEYMQLVEKSPPLKAEGLTMPYKKLVEFDGIVLGGIEHKDGSGYEFSTWEWVDNGKSLWQGHYFTNYDKAKEDFAVRSGLVAESKMFQDREWCEICRCVSDTLEGDYEITDNQRMMLEDIRSRIKDGLPDMDELIRQADREFEQSL